MDIQKAYENIYNCIARLVRFLYDNTPDIKDYASLMSDEIESPNGYTSFDEILEKRFRGILYNRDGTIPIDDNNYSEVSEIIESATDELIINKGMRQILLFFQILDKALQKNIMGGFWKGELDKENFFNSNEKDTGIGILPYYHSRWDLASERNNRSHDINAFVYWFLIVDLNNFKDIDVKNIYLDSRLKISSDNLKVGLSPLWKWINFAHKQEIEDGRKVINIKYNSDFEKENEIICKTIDKAAEDKVDILVFPEMLGNAEMKNTVRKKMLKSRFEFPKIIVLPSFWKDGKNTARVVNKYGLEIFEQGKQIPFIDKDKYYENLESYKELNVLHIRDFGRILVMICRDFLEVRKLEKILNELRPTMILVPSFSEGYHDFDRVKGICEGHECVVVWVNSCAVGAIEDPIGFIDKAGHLLTRGKDNMTEFFSCKERGDGCGKYCENVCLYTDTLINYKKQ